ncbi:Gfo/Idh/MocA family protein [Paenarthrobacter sp. NPDC089714]|uniref:Gfo/Idh/MocA family protein n=1 Tax=Paenarthrobacter sp. NPDC089714 TaxID=3364377 RepID=UPI0037F37885
MEPVRVGIIGVGNVLDQYLARASMHDEISVDFLADLNVEAAGKQAAQYDIPKYGSVEELLSMPEIEMVANFTPPAFHASVTAQILQAGKHVFTEKPFATSLTEAEELIDLAREKGLKISSAPATLLGGGMQTSRKLVDDGFIGRPLSAVATFTCRGFETWHPNIDPFYSPGGGPLLDLGPYLVSNLLNIFGPAKRVSGVVSRSSETRPRYKDGKRVGEIQVQVPTHISGNIEFKSGAVATLITSWDIWNASLPFMEIYGTQGVLSTPHTAFYAGEPTLRRGDPRDLTNDWYPPHGGDWRTMPLTHRNDVGRAIGLAELAHSIRHSEDSRLDMDFAYHSLEILLALEKSSASGSYVEIESTCRRPAALPPAGADDPIRFD